MVEELDLIDRKILYELDLNARISTTQLAKKLRVGRETTNYRINRLVKKGIIRKFVTMTNPAMFGYSVYKLFLKFQNLDKEKEKELLDCLMKNDYIYWIASCRGKYDLNFCVFAKNINHYEEIMSVFFEKYGNYILEQEFNTTLEVGIMSKDWLLPEKNLLSKLVYFGGNNLDIQIDEIDLQLLKILANNGRMNANKIAEKMNSTTRIVLYRMKELEKKGVILGYTISLDLNILKKQFFKTIIYFTHFNKKLKQKIVEYSRNNKNIGFFVFCVGSWSLELELIVDDNNQFYKIMDDLKQTFLEMKGYEFLMFPKEYKFDWVPQCYKPEKTIK